MSYDLRIAVKVEGIDKFATIDEPEYYCPTYNLGDMFRACTGWDFEQGKYYKCSEVIENISRGIIELRKDRLKYRTLEPDNHFGTVDDAIRVLDSLLICIYENAEEIPMEFLYVAW